MQILSLKSKLVLVVACAIGVGSLSFIKSPVVVNRLSPPASDTIPGKHITDGLGAEWPVGVFRPDSDSTIFFAADNDDKNLYAVLTIPDFSMQSKLMQNGMKLFIDIKGKKKESHGVEFPVSGEVNSFMKGSFPEPATKSRTGESPTTQPQKDADRKAVHIMSLGLTALKTFGLSGGSDEEQGLLVPGSVNIAFKWDADDVMYIEYSIPLSFINESSLQKKEISLGWKVNGFERPSGQDNSNRQRGGMGEGRGSVMGFNNAAGRPQRRMSMAEMAREQDFWVNYTVK